ncbi:MAG TPA: toll/interleukin-1 receptor domain-containing protein, partial [Terriglobales bacterium]
MAYVPGFQYDLFVSYACNDDDGRLAQFVNNLRVYLAGELGKLFTERSVFFDRQDLNRTPLEWKKKLEQSAESAAILVPFLSPRYVDSDYCAKELEWFLEEPPLRWPAGTEEVYRVCPVLWRAFDAEMMSQIAPEIRSAQEQRSPGVEEFGQKIANGLRLMRRSRQTVFVGETENEARQKVRDEMSRMGFRVMPSAPMAYSDPHLIRTQLGEARLAVHFVGGQARQRPIEAIQWSRQDCHGATVVYEV